MEILVSDTVPLVALAKLQLLPQLHQVIESLHLPTAVIAEATQAGKPFAQDIEEFVRDNSDWVICQQNAVGVNIEALAGRFGAGEVQAMHWAGQLKVPLLIDERRARAAAREMGLQVVGIGAVLLRCKQVGILPLVLPALRTLETMAYFLSPKVIEAIAEMAGEN